MRRLYYLRLLPEHLDLGVDILADILTESTLPSEEIERERGVIIQEIDNHLIRQMTWFSIYSPQRVMRVIVLAAPYLELLIVFHRSADRISRRFAAVLWGRPNAFLCCRSIGS